MGPRQRVLIIGGGAREHALAWKLARSPEVGRLYVAPGNGGTETIAENIPIKTTDIARLKDFARAENIDLALVGPDDALAAGTQSQANHDFPPARNSTR